MTYIPSIDLQQGNFWMTPPSFPLSTESKIQNTLRSWACKQTDFKKWMWLTPKRSLTFQLIKKYLFKKNVLEWSGNKAFEMQPGLNNNTFLDFSSPLHILYGEEAKEPAGSSRLSPPWPRISLPPLLRPSARGQASGRTLKLLPIPFGSMDQAPKCSS